MRGFFNNQAEVLETQVLFCIFHLPEISNCVRPAPRTTKLICFKNLSVYICKCVFCTKSKDCEVYNVLLLYNYSTYNQPVGRLLTTFWSQQTFQKLSRETLIRLFYTTTVLIQAPCLLFVFCTPVCFNRKEGQDEEVVFKLRTTTPLHLALFS